MRRLLHVEDDPIDRATLARACNGGWLVTGADTLTEGVQHAEAGGWSAAVTDLRGVAPHDDGARIVEQLAAARRRLGGAPQGA